MAGVAERVFHLSVRVIAFLIGLLGFLLLLPAAAGAQPFGVWSIFSATQGKYFDIASSPDLNPTAAITIEAWVATVGDERAGATESCRSVIGKDRQTSYWVGVCGNTLRSYLKGGIRSFRERRHGAEQPVDAHRGDVRRGQPVHYINGEVVGTFPETGAASDERVARPDRERRLLGLPAAGGP